MVQSIEEKLRGYCRDHLALSYFRDNIRAIARGKSVKNPADWQVHLDQLKKKTGLTLNDLREHYAYQSHLFVRG